MCELDNMIDGKINHVADAASHKKFLEKNSKELRHKLATLKNENANLTSKQNVVL